MRFRHTSENEIGGGAAPGKGRARFEEFKFDFSHTTQPARGCGIEREENRENDRFYQQ